MARKRKNKRRNRKPDDYFAAGPLELARFGKVIVSRSRASPEEFEAAQSIMAGQLPTIVAEIDALIEKIAQRVSRLSPEQLLHRAWWEFAFVAIGLHGKSLEDVDQIVSMRMIDYIQSVIASVEPTRALPEDVTAGGLGWAKGGRQNSLHAIDARIPIVCDCKTALGGTEPRHGT